MMRRAKNTNLKSKTDERGLQKASDWRSPFAWLEDMDRWFDEFRRDFEARLWGSPGLVEATSPGLQGARGLRSPLADLADTGREFVVRAEVPGVAKEDLDISVTPDGIELHAESKTEKEEKENDFFFRERSYRAFRRALSFPAEVLADEAEATLKDGVLEVRVPKKDPTPRREPVKVRVN